MTRARDDLHLVAPLRFYVTQQAALRRPHVYGARSRFLTERVLARWSRSAGRRAPRGRAGAPARPLAPRVDVGARLRALWDCNCGRRATGWCAGVRGDGDGGGETPRRRADHRGGADAARFRAGRRQRRRRRSHRALVAAAAPVRGRRCRPRTSPATTRRALTGLRGTHPGSFEAAHALRDGARSPAPREPGEIYDLVVVGGGHQRPCRGALLSASGTAGARPDARQSRRLRRPRQAQRVRARRQAAPAERRHLQHRQPAAV